MPIVGIVLQGIRSHYLEVSRSPWPADKAFAYAIKEAHEILANLLVILALFHMTAALLITGLWREHLEASVSARPRAGLLNPT